MLKSTTMSTLNPTSIDSVLQSTIPDQPDELKETKMGCRANTNMNLVTNQVQGLEIMTKDGPGVQARFSPNSFIVQTGDAFTAWSNVSTARKFQPRVKVNTQPKDKLPASHAISVAAEGSINHDEAPNFHASNVKDLEGGPGLASLSTFDCPTLRRCGFAPTNSSSNFSPNAH
ncbi:hypothetical protein IFM89_011950 [Coptis chinensis]|uniref:Isopenicillin N synthase-like Fe(2+) 2OG dioxygenase domain-containing protein n=1 Tax=Coptis chinensis TaxID=261450 RepID=A0A835H5F5_9MAGN|nr:hypothetical protein IFM89_011950 [Coptis chinensis]